MSRAAAWFNAQSFNGPRNRAENEHDAREVKADACWDSWDVEQGRWRHYSRKAGTIIETNEIGIEL